MHPIVPIMLGDAALATKVADAMLEKGVYVIGFSYPVVPKGKARIRTQISAAHSREDLEFALEQFGKVKAELGLYSERAMAQVLSMNLLFGVPALAGPGRLKAGHRTDGATQAGSWSLCTVARPRGLSMNL